MASTWAKFKFYLDYLLAYACVVEDSHGWMDMRRPVDK